MTSDTASEAAGQTSSDEDQTGSRQGLPAAGGQRLVVLTDTQYRQLIVWLTSIMGQRRAQGGTLSRTETETLVAVLPQRGASVVGSEFDGSESVAAALGCTTREAAKRLGCTTRAVRLACARGDLVSRQPDGRGPLVIDERSVAAYAQKRAARAA